MMTIHGCTAGQQLVDGPGRTFRRTDLVRPTWGLSPVCRWVTRRKRLPAPFVDDVAVEADVHSGAPWAPTKVLFQGANANVRARLFAPPGRDCR
jgi:hypothetical protein